MTYCSGCEMSEEEVAKSYEAESFDHCDEVVHMNAGHWYCHSDCLSDCF